MRYLYEITLLLRQISTPVKESFDSRCLSPVLALLTRKHLRACHPRLLTSITASYTFNLTVECLVGRAAEDRAYSGMLRGATLRSDL